MLLDGIGKDAKPGADIQQANVAAAAEMHLRKRGNPRDAPGIVGAFPGKRNDALERGIQTGRILVSRVDIVSLIVGRNRHGVARDIMI